MRFKRLSWPSRPNHDAPVAARQSPRDRRVGACLNCGAAITGAYCAACGQEARDFHVSFWEMVVDIVDNQFNLNSRTVKSVFLLLCRPGYMTREYNSGKRARFISPTRLYLIVSVLFFLALAQTGAPAGLLQPDELAVLEQALRDPSQVVLTPSEVERPLERRQGQAFAPSEEQGFAQANVLATGLASAQTPLFDQTPRDDTGVSLEKPITLQDLSNETPWLQFSLTKLQALTAHGFDVFLRQMYERLLENIPRLMFVLLPVFALLLKLLYIRSGALYLEHVTFSLHLHSFAFLLFTAVTLLLTYAPPAFAVEDYIVDWAMLALVVYMFAAMKVVYRQGYVKTAIKFWLLLTSYVTVVALAMVLVTVVTFAML